MRAEKRAYEKVIRMIAHEVNNTTAGHHFHTRYSGAGHFLQKMIWRTSATWMRVCTERCFSMSRFITRFADVVKIPEPTPGARPAE